MRKLAVILVLYFTKHSTFGSGPNLYASQFSVVAFFCETVSKFLGLQN